MSGADVKALQAALNKRAKARNLETIDVDGEYGRETRELYRRVGYLLGFLDSTLDKGATVAAQRLIRDPSKRNKAQLARARKRAKAVGGPEALIRWARAQVGVTERPAGSNKGPKVSKWQREFGIDGAPWCGAFVGFGLRTQCNVPVTRRIVYCPFIEADARTHANGFARFVSARKAKPGDLVLFDFSRPVTFPQHVGIVVSVDRARGVVHTIEGNTSPGAAGSQANGGGVFARTRPFGTVVGYARPRFKG